VTQNIDQKDNEGYDGGKVRVRFKVKAPCFIFSSELTVLEYIGMYTSVDSMT
jgi:hypothetical protein